MRIVIPGGSGQVGQVLARGFVADGHEVVVLSRSLGKAPWKIVVWDAKTIGGWVSEIETADVVINLTGRSVNCRYNTANRQAIMESRVQSTRAIGEAISKAASPPRVWLQASTATIYSHRYDAPNDEATGLLGGSEPGAPDSWRFSIEVATAWERMANEANTPHTRKVLLRLAVLMSPSHGGTFELLLGMVRRGLGGRNGDGRQYVSWIHDQDFVRSVNWLIEHDLQGPVNLAAPHPVPNAEFMRAFRQAWGISFGMPATRLMLEVAVFFMRSETELVLKSRRVVPSRLLESGFEFRFPTWAEAVADLCRRWREIGRPGAANA